MSLRPIKFFALVVSAACSGGGDTGTASEADACLPGDAPTLTIGKGELGYESLDGDISTELIHGPQGGFHVNLALEATQLDASTKWTVGMEGVIDGELIADNVRYVDMRCNPSVPALQAWSIFLIFDAQPEDLHGRHALVEVVATDAAGTVVSADAEIDIFDPSLE